MQVDRHKLYIASDMKETPRRRTTVTSSLDEMSTEQLGKNSEGVTFLRRLHPFVQQASGQIMKDDVNGFSSTLDIFFLASENFPNSA